MRCVFACEQGIVGGEEGVQRGVLREDTRGRVSARLCRLALTATDAGLKWESSWAACLPIQQENKSHVEEPLCGITDSRLTPQIRRGRPRAPARQRKLPPLRLPTASPHPPPGSNVTLPACQLWNCGVAGPRWSNTVLTQTSSLGRLSFRLSLYHKNSTEVSQRLLGQTLSKCC